MTVLDPLFLADDLSQRRKDVGASVAEVAGLVGVSPWTVHAWEVEQHQPWTVHADRWLAAVEQLERHRLAGLLERHWMRG